MHFEKLMDVISHYIDYTHTSISRYSFNFCSKNIFHTKELNSQFKFSIRLVNRKRQSQWHTPTYQYLELLYCIRFTIVIEKVEIKSLI